MSVGAGRGAGEDVKPLGLAVLAGMISISAIGGAIGLITGSIWLPEDVAQRLPFQSPQFAGAALALVVGMPTAVLAALAALGRPESDRVAQITGVVVICWILVEVAFIRELSFFHPVYIALGCLLVIVGSHHESSSGRRPNRRR